VETGPDKGACFTMTLPLTLAIVDALIVGVGERIFAVPKPSVREVVEFETSSISTMENNEMISYRGEVLSLFGLCPFFGIEEKPRETRYALVIGQGTGTLGLVVDRVVTIREIVVQTVSDPLVKVPGILGATELGDRRAVVILDTAELSRAAQHKGLGKK
jgi:two-component system, chemotaxis family, sensor kinase CheA